MPEFDKYEIPKDFTSHAVDETQSRFSLLGCLNLYRESLGLEEFLDEDDVNMDIGFTKNYDEAFIELRVEEKETAEFHVAAMKLNKMFFEVQKTSPSADGFVYVTYIPYTIQHPFSACRQEYHDCVNAAKSLRPVSIFIPQRDIRYGFAMLWIKIKTAIADRIAKITKYDPVSINETLGVEYVWCNSQELEFREANSKLSRLDETECHCLGCQMQLDGEAYVKSVRRTPETLTWQVETQ